MAKFWFVSAPLFSHTDWGGFLKTAKVLQANGHEVIWVSEPSLESAIRQNNLMFEAIAKTGWLWPPPPPPDLTTIKPQEAVMLRYTRALDTWLSEDLVAEGIQALLDLAERIGKPDAMVIDPFLTAAALAAEKLNVPMIVAGWLAAANLDEQALFPVQRNLSSDSQQRILRLCEKFGLEGTYFSKGAAPSIISPYLHITYFTPEWYMAESASILIQTQFVGGKPAVPAEPAPDWLNDIPAEKPLALITLGTIFTGDAGFFAWAAQAAARQGLTPIVVIGWNPMTPEEKAELKRALPPGTRLLNWVPFEHVLPRSKIMIHHGGMGTTHAATVYGVPQIVVPHAADQRIQARRVAQAKIGLNLTAHDVRQGMLRDGVKALMEADQVHETCRRFAERMASLGGAERAAELIVQALARAAS
jgi:MGT family glycosyltransferase